MNEKYIADYKRRFKTYDALPKRIVRFMKNHEIQVLYWMRKEETSRLLKPFYKYKLSRIYRKYGISMTSKSFMGGVLLCYAHNITVNSRAIIGENCTIFGGVTIGSVRSGKREGVPVIGNNVVLGMNSFVCGGIHIGNDVLIAANSFVDCDVPDHSLVFGNPGIVKSKNNSTIDYL